MRMIALSLFSAAPCLIAQDVSALTPTDADRNTLAALVMDDAGWKAHQQALRELWRGGAKSPMAEAARTLGGERGITPSQPLADLVRLYAHPAADGVLRRLGLDARTFALWSKGLYYYRIYVDLMDRAGMKAPAGAWRGHEGNLRWVQTRARDIDAVLAEVFGPLEAEP